MAVRGKRGGILWVKKFTKGNSLENLPLDTFLKKE
jgi:hypothetical protein